MKVKVTARSLVPGGGWTILTKKPSNFVLGQSENDTEREKREEYMFGYTHIFTFSKCHPLCCMYYICMYVLYMYANSILKVTHRNTHARTA